MQLGNPAQDLLSLTGLIPSSHRKDVLYRLNRVLGGGAMAHVFLATREGPEGQGPVVIKLTRPDFVLQAGSEATKVAMKEEVALGRLGERVPSTACVVRLLETGTIACQWNGKLLDLPWICIEYVDGGGLGTTLTNRVEVCVTTTGFGFPASRAVRAIQCLSLGLTAVHEVGVIHRDLKPDNVLCCGKAEDELLKVADFGVARPEGVAATFHGSMVGTIGYCPPECFDIQHSAIGPWSDVFAFGAVVFYLLTGEDYFPTSSVAESLAQVFSPRRRSVLECPALHPEIRNRESACRAIDEALAKATTRDPKQRYLAAADLASTLTISLDSQAWNLRRQPETPSAIGIPKEMPAWTWLDRHCPYHDLVVKSIAWNADASLLAATTCGLVFWDGTTYRTVSDPKISRSSAHFVARLSRGRWLVGYDDFSYAIFADGKIEEVMHLPNETQALDAFDGDLGDLAVALVGGAAKPQLHGLVGRHWLRPLSVSQAAAILSLCRMNNYQWLVTGRAQDGGMFAGIYSPLDWELSPIQLPEGRALLCSASERTLHLAIAGGTGGTVLWMVGEEICFEKVPGEFDISAVALDSSGTAWAAGAGHLAIRRQTQSGGVWELLWDDDGEVPVVSMLASEGQLTAVRADGAIFEGRAVRMFSW